MKLFNIKTRVHKFSPITQCIGGKLSSIRSVSLQKVDAFKCPLIGPNTVKNEAVLSENRTKAQLMNRIITRHF